MKGVGALRIVGWVSLVVAIGVCVALPLIHEPWVSNKSNPDSILGEEGLFEQFQWPWYFFGMALLFVVAKRTADDEPVRGEVDASAPVGVRRFLFAVGVVFFLLGWREVDLDTVLLGERWYNAPGKVLEEELSWAVRITLLAIFVVFIAVIWSVFVRCRGAVGRWLRAHRWGRAAAMGVVGCTLLAIGLLVDKVRTVREELGIDVRLSHPAYVEEVAELLGAIVMFLFAVALVRARERMRDEE